MRSSVKTVSIAFVATIALAVAKVAVAAEPVAPPTIKIIMPLERPAPTDEIIGGIEACRSALGDDGKFDETVFKSLHWRRGATYRDASSDVRTEYYNRNLINDIVLLDRVDGCFTKAKISNLAQIAAVRESATKRYELKPVDSQTTYTGLVRHLVDQFGKSASEKLLFGEQFVLVLEPTTRGADTYLSITYVPLRKESKPQ